MGLQPGMPLSDAQREAIEDARGKLSDQLISASGRRREAAEALKTAEGADRSGLEQRVIQLDQRILQLEADIAETGRLLTSAPVDFDFYTSSTAPPPPWQLPDANVTAISIVFTIFVLAPMALAAARLMWKRAVTPRAPAPSPEAMHRLERVEQAIDAVAVEIERISEGQRFVTRILTEGPARTALGGGKTDASQLGTPRREPVRVPREEL